MGAIASEIISLTIVYSIVYFKHRWRKTSKLRVTGICVGNSPVTGEFPAQMASNAENASIWWRHHVCQLGPISGRWNGVHQTQFTSKPIYSANKT